MILTNKQQEGLNIAVQRYKDREPYTVISGYAGSGKSTLIKFIISALNLEDEEVAYVAYTGKAAQVLKQKGCPNAETAHKLLYKAVRLPSGNFNFTAKLTLDNHKLKIIVVDEVSMLPKTMWDLLLRHRVYILATGDPGQLPPINKEDDNHVLDNPHIFLDEIMRQAQESEIIRLSMHIREGKPLATFTDYENKQVRIVDKEQVVTGMYDWADQIICATNRKRNELNNAIRTLKGYGPEPTVNDKIISLHNHWDFLSSDNSSVLTNGSIGSIEWSQKQSMYIPAYISDKRYMSVLYSNIITEDGSKFNSVPIDYTLLTTGEKLLTPQQEYKLLKNKRCADPPFEFAYGYAITGHKAQGSEWNKVLVFEEYFPTSVEEHKRWLYTAATRASDKLVIVKK